MTRAKLADILYMGLKAVVVTYVITSLFFGLTGGFWPTLMLATVIVSVISFVADSVPPNLAFFSSDHNNPVPRAGHPVTFWLNQVLYWGMASFAGIRWYLDTGAGPR